MTWWFLNFKIFTSCKHACQSDYVLWNWLRSRKIKLWELRNSKWSYEASFERCDSTSWISWCSFYIGLLLLVHKYYTTTLSVVCITFLNKSQVNGNMLLLGKCWLHCLALVIRCTMLQLHSTYLTQENKNYSFWTTLLVLNIPEQCGIILCSPLYSHFKTSSKWSSSTWKRADTTSKLSSETSSKSSPTWKTITFIVIDYSFFCSNSCWFSKGNNRHVSIVTSQLKTSRFVQNE